MRGATGMRGADILLFPRGEEDSALQVAGKAQAILTKEQREQGFRWVVWEAMHWEEGEVLAIVLCEGTAPTQWCLSQGWWEVLSSGVDPGPSTE